IERNQEQLAAAHSYLQSILSNLSAGVLAFDETLRLRSFNHSASDILGADVGALASIALNLWAERVPELNAFAAELAASFNSNAANEWKKQFERPTPHGHQMLLLRGTRLPVGGDTGFVVVFDDI